MRVEMATIKPIEGSSIHQIQSGQVIVDLCSVVKELVENSLDAGATSLDVRFKNHGLDSIEVQDNGGGIAPEDFESIALKHHTSKLSTYDDLSALQTFGFRGEALSSLCALSTFHIITARASDGPKGTKLDFEVSGKLKGTSVVASTKGTTVAVERIFHNLPVRKRELEKNIKREYGKVLSVLHAYACISTDVKFTVSNQMPKGKKLAVFATKANPTTKENIANVYGAKTLLALIPLDLKLEMQRNQASTQSARNWSTQEESDSKGIQILGHISRPVVGEGRQTPDRQMFYVNSRPCGLPQVTKAVNEVYKSYNVTQSPFVFANFIMDTNAYDVNVSPDKRTILLHDQTALLESLKTSLIELFEAHDQSVPKSQLFSTKKLQAFRPLSVSRKESTASADRESPIEPVFTCTEEVSRDESPQSIDKISPPAADAEGTPESLLQRFGGRNSESRSRKETESPPPPPKPDGLSKEKQRLLRSIAARKSREPEEGDNDSVEEDSESENDRPTIAPRPVLDFNARIASQHARSLSKDKSTRSPSPQIEEEIPSVTQCPAKSQPGPVQSAFDRMRPNRTPVQTATITIGDTTTISTIGSTPYKRRRIHTPKDQPGVKDTRSPLLFKSLRAFAAPGVKFPSSQGDGDEEIGTPERDPGEERDNDSTPESSNEPSNSTDRSKFRKDITMDGEMEVEIEDDLGPVTADGEEDDSDEEYMDEAAKKAKEERKIARMIAQAEEAAARPTQDNLKRAAKVLKGPMKKYSTLELVQSLPTSTDDLQRGLSSVTNALMSITMQDPALESNDEDGPFVESAEEKLSLTVSKSDFGQMRIIGQFNLGFILAIRPGHDSLTDELFIVDQHASDEKYNFERLQQSTILTPQRLVHPHPLQLTAIEEVIIESHSQALEANGFHISTDKSGDVPVGSRCSLLTLPTSREVTFTPADLEELLVLLSESVGGDIPRPAKVRRLLAMRACRGSVMVGKTMTKGQMERVVRHMGELEKPWNCPHGRPTMRHLFGMANWEGWREGDGIAGLSEARETTDWRNFLKMAERE